MYRLGVINDADAALGPIPTSVSLVIPSGLEIESAGDVNVAVPRLSDWYPPQIFVDEDPSKGVKTDSVGKAYYTAAGAPKYHSDMMASINDLFGSATAFVAATDELTFDPKGEQDNSTYWGGVFLSTYSQALEDLASYRLDLDESTFRMMAAREAGALVTGMQLQELNYHWQKRYQAKWSDGAMQLWPYIRYDYVSYDIVLGSKPKIWSWGLYLCPMIQEHREMLAIAKATLDNAFELRTTLTLFEQMMGATLGSSRAKARIWYDQFLDYYEETTGIKTPRQEDQPGVTSNWEKWLKAGLWIAGAGVGVYALGKIATIVRSN